MTETLIGQRGTITVATRGQAGPGEVELKIGGGPMRMLAYSTEPIERHREVVVLNDRGGNRVDVSTID